MFYSDLMQFCAPCTVNAIRNLLVCTEFLAFLILRIISRIILVIFGKKNKFHFGLSLPTLICIEFSHSWKPILRCFLGYFLVDFSSFSQKKEFIPLFYLAPVALSEDQTQIPSRGYGSDAVGYPHYKFQVS